MIRYAHTNIIARDVQSLTRFYKSALHCKSIGETRDLKGRWLDDLTNLQDAHITGEHLLLPGCDGAKQPTLEIFSYDELKEAVSSTIFPSGSVAYTNTACLPLGYGVVIIWPRALPPGTDNIR